VTVESTQRHELATQRHKLATQRDELATQRDELAEAAHVLARLGLVTAFGHVSARISGDRMLITPAADLATVTAAAMVDVPLDARQLPAGAPAEAWAHLALYRARPGAGSVARAQPAGAFAAAAACRALVPVHGQAAWLGESVPVHDSARLLRSAELAERAAASLPAGEALLLRGNGALTLGASPGVAVARMWLLSAACDTWLAARAAGHVTPLTVGEIASWRAAADELLPRLWQHLRRRAAGELAVAESWPEVTENSREVAEHAEEEPGMSSPADTGAAHEQIRLTRRSERPREAPA
jgi:HCOMODA/2-hydroxy-3-carboxy-muconic semialdehyde decarboxylase